MKTPRILLQQTINSREVVIRAPQFSDAQAMQEYINELSAEKTFILLQGKQMTLEEEQAYVKSNLKNIEEGRAVKGLLFVDDVLAGIADVDQCENAESPQGGFGISIRAAFRGQGYGRLLMQTVLTEAERVLPIRMIVLKHFGDNTIARKLYESLGFTEVGRIPQGLLHNGEYVDDVIMARPVQKS